MYNIYFYEDQKGHQPVAEYILELSRKKDKDSRIKLKKIHEYIKILSIWGTQAGEPYVKHIEGHIWELRPLRDRIFFVVWTGNSFVLLHHFVKKTQKTPVKEIEKAKKELKYLLEGGVFND